MRFPDFIIGGAMKCATSSLHQILNQHPRIFIPDGEIHCLDMDDAEQHPDFFTYSGGHWTYPAWDQHQDKYLRWYSAFFEPARPDQLAGEDSTTYIASEKPPARMLKLNPKMKLIFMLRDPAARTYSHYWHIVRSGRATHSFEKTLQFSPGTMLQRSMYKAQLDYYFSVFPRERIKIVLFEDFTKKLPQVLDDVLAFLELPNVIRLSEGRTQWNQARVPFSLPLTLFQNNLLRARSVQGYSKHLPLEMPQSWRNRLGSGMRDLAYLAFAATSRRSARTPPMRPETHAFLDEYFRNANAGLSELIGMDVEQKWYATRRGSSVAKGSGKPG